MKYLITGVMSAGILALSAANVLAADGKVAFNGSITDSACTVTSTSQNRTVKLGNVSSASLSGAAGMVSANVAFPIELNNCPESFHGKTVSFILDGTSANDDNTALQLTPEPGAATGVGVQILYRGNVQQLYTPIVAANPIDKNGTWVGILYARYLSLASTVTAGSANSTSNFTIVYN